MVWAGSLEIKKMKKMRLSGEETKDLALELGEHKAGVHNFEAGTRKFIKGEWKGKKHIKKVDRGKPHSAIGTRKRAFNF